MFSVDVAFCGQKFTSTEGKLLKRLTENVTSSQLAASWPWFGLFQLVTVQCTIVAEHKADRFNTITPAQEL